ncbi:MAG: hypothetical protein IT285_12365 [Bdellovibrionales bacterium]|nr:hypothetical protein [Bdellovibrionales bacterium]
MAANRMRLQGAVSEDPAAANKDVEALVRGFIRALAAEYGEAPKPVPDPAPVPMAEVGG